MSEGKTIVLETIDLCHSGLHPLTLKVAQGEIFGILGPRWSGKTAAFNLLSGKSSPTSGQLQILGKDFWRHERELRRLVGACASPQHDINTPGLEYTAREHLNFEAGLIGISYQKYRDRIDEVLAFVGLSAHDTLPVAAFPGDMRRRLALARALLTKPELVVIDEPTTGVAEERCERIWNLLRGLQDAGKTIVLTTSSWQEVQEVCNWVAPLCEGELQEVMAP
jgi:ABC-type multidrug transport system ATPase subunit